MAISMEVRILVENLKKFTYSASLTCVFSWRHCIFDLTLT